jgi:phospholipid/cholesterol/gamma-HCH transport system substrate-binding protein
MPHTNRLVGVFVIGGLLLFGTGMFLIGDRHQLFSRHREYYSEFVNLAGLTNGAKVRVAGMDAGQVTAIAVPNSPSSRFRVRWRIESKLTGLVRTDSLATIGTEGIVGGTYLAVRQGSAQATEAAPLSIVPSGEATDLSEVVSRGAGLVNDAREAINDLRAKLDVALDRVASTTSNVNEIVVGIKQGQGTAGMLLRDKGVANALRSAVDAAATGIQGLVADLQDGHGLAGMLLKDEAVAGRVREAVANIQHASGQADALISDLSSHQAGEKAGEVLDNLTATTRQIRQLLAEISAPDFHGVTAGVNVREALTNANAAAANLADATEALKHNFLTRGFFKDRGYYTLADIPPDTYRQDRIFTSRANQRVWLSGSDLFQRTSNGAEELSTSGKDVLDATFAEYGDAILEKPVVVEGYSSGAARDQLRLSRSRAFAVRQYLQTRVQIDIKNLGIVPLKAKPPAGVGRTTWDGICLVVLNGH